MEFWKEVRRQVLTNELSQRAACKKYGLGWHTLKKILAHAEPPGYRVSQPRPKRKLEPLPERNPLRNNTLFCKSRKCLSRIDLRSSSPFRCQKR